MRQAEAAFGGGSSEAGASGLGSASEASVTPVTPAASPTPAPSPTPGAAPPPLRPTTGGLPPSGSQPLGVPGVRRRRRSGCGAVGIVVVLGIVAGVGGGIWALVSSVSDTVDRVRSSPVFNVPSVPSIPNVPTPTSPSGPTGGGSYFTASGLRAAKTKAVSLTGRGARIQLARIASGQLQVIARNGSRGRIVLVSPGVTRRIDTPTGANTGNEFGFAALRPAVVGRLTATLRRRFHVSPGRIDYMVVLRDPISKNIEWLVYPRGGSAHFQANAAGGDLRRVG